MNQDLVRYENNLIEARLKQFLSDADSVHNVLKAKAAKAIVERDWLAIWHLTESFMLTKGKKRTRTSQHTLKAYRAAIKRLMLEYWQDVNLLRPTPNNVDSLMIDLEKKSIGTQRVYISAYKMLYRMLRFTKVCSKAQPFQDVVIQSDSTASNAKREAYTNQEVTKLLEVADKEQSLIIVLGAWSGLRNSEIAKLQWSDVNLLEQTVLVREGKGNKTAKAKVFNGTPLNLLSVHMGTGLVIDSIKNLKTDSRRCDAIRDMIQTVCILAGVKYKGAHSFRHHLGSWAAVNGYNAYQIKELLRHKSIETSQIYIKDNALNVFNDVTV